MTARGRLTPDQRRERLDAARRRLDEAIDNLMTADGWQAMVRARARLRHYSFANLMMILAQYPEARDVRPLKEWNRVGRRVRRGEHAIRIWAPRLRNAEPTGDDDTATPDGPTRKRLIGYILVNVFDVTQTEGEPLPALPRQVELTGSAPDGLWASIATQIQDAGYRVDRGDCGRAYGQTDFTTRTVRVRDGVEPAQAAKTLVHELAHILCEHDTRHGVPRPVMEIEAESVACIVATAFGMDTLEYSVRFSQ